MSNLLQRRGNSIYILFREYMKKNISINELIIYLLFQGLLQKHNITLLNHPYDKLYYENYVIDELEYYLKEVKYNKNLTKEISASILPNFIEEDNKRLKKILRKLLIIKKRQEQKLKMHNFYRWMININKKISKKNNNKLISKEKTIKLKKEEKKELNDKENISKSIRLLNIEKYNDKKIASKNRINKALNLKLTKHKNRSLLKPDKTNKKSKTISLISSTTSPNIINNSQISTNHINKSQSNKNRNKIKSKIKNEYINKSCSSSIPKKSQKMTLSQETTRKEKFKTPKENQKMIKHFMNNLIVNEKVKEEKMKNLNIKNEEKIDSIYTFTPKLLENKNNEKYLKNMIDKLYFENFKDNRNNNTMNNDDICDNDFDSNENNLNIVLEENRNNKDTNFISRLDEYEKRRINNLEKIKNDIIEDHCINNNTNKYNSFNDKYNITDDHLLKVSNSYFVKKQNLINKLIKDIDKEKGITFEPKLNNDYNNKIKNKFNNLKEALSIKKNEKIFNYLTNRDKECTFQPRINDININSSNLINNRSDVGERLLAYQDKYNQNLIKIKNKYPKYSFKPKISKNTYNILNKRRRIIKNMKEKIAFNNISARDNKQKFEEEKYSFKIKEKKYKLENKENFTPIFEFNKKEKEQDDIIDFNDFNFDKNSENSELEEKINLSNRYIKSCMINNKYKYNNNNSNKIKTNNNNKNLMTFDYYENLL